MGTELRDILSEDEKLAIEVLEKAGWSFVAEVSVEKATPMGDRWPSYTLGREYVLGILLPEPPKVSPGRPKKKSRAKR
jgi:hypothetical protein